jgi:type I restriction-modification system DNA methylase subunit
MFARAVSQAEIAKQGYNLSILLYVKRAAHENGQNHARPLPELWAEWEQQDRLFW